MCQRQFLGYHYKSLILKYRMCFNVGFGLFEAQIIHFLASGRPSYCFLSLRYNTALNGSTKVNSTGPLVIGNWFVSSFFLLGSAAVNSLCRCFFSCFDQQGLNHLIFPQTVFERVCLLSTTLSRECLQTFI